MKSILVLLITVTLLCTGVTCFAQSPSTDVVVYPATIHSMVSLWSSLFEVCAEATIPPYNVHVEGMDSNNIILKLESKWYVPFLQAYEKKMVTKPMVRVDQQAGKITSYATFGIKLSWPTNVVTSLDNEVQKLTVAGIPIEEKMMTVYVIAVGKIEMDKVMAYMQSEEKE